MISQPQIDQTIASPERKRPLYVLHYEMRMESYRARPTSHVYVLKTRFGEFTYHGPKQIAGVSVYVAKLKRRIQGRMIYPGRYFAVWHSVGTKPAPWVLAGRIVCTYRTGWVAVERKVA